MTAKKNIGILFSVSRKMGVFQYGLSIAEGLINYCSDFNYTILYFGNENPKNDLKIKNLDNIKFVSLDANPNNFFGKIKFFLNCGLGRPLFTTNKKNREIMEGVRLDFLIIPFQLLFGFEHKIPYMVSIPDMMYKYYSHLTEYSLKSRLINDFIFGSATKHSVFVITDSNSGKEDVHKFLKIPCDKIEPIPYLPAGYIFGGVNMNKEEAEELLKKYNLPEKFIFYPAQFWAHKNHENLIKSIKIAEEKYGEKVFLALAGSDKANPENYRKVMDSVKKLNIKNRISHLGYVSDQEIVALYKKATALVFPTLIGPTNIPPLEAMILGTPVLCSNLFAMPEQLGEAGVLFDPFDPGDMAEKISRVWKNENLRKQMIEKGYERVKNLTVENHADMWIRAVKKAMALSKKANEKVR